MLSFLKKTNSEAKVIVDIYKVRTTDNTYSDVWAQLGVEQKWFGQLI